jgi:solute carrier family 35 protein F5
MRGHEIDQPSATTPLSPRVSDASTGSRYMRENDFLESPIRSPASEVSMWDEGRKKPNSKLRHAIGIALLLATVFLWTASNFLASVSLLHHFAPLFVTGWDEMYC